MAEGLGHWHWRCVAKLWAILKARVISPDCVRLAKAFVYLPNVLCTTPFKCVMSQKLFSCAVRFPVPRGYLRLWMRWHFTQWTKKSPQQIVRTAKKGLILCKSFHTTFGAVLHTLWRKWSTSNTSAYTLPIVLMQTLLGCWASVLSNSEVFTATLAGTTTLFLFSTDKPT